MSSPLSNYLDYDSDGNQIHKSGLGKFLYDGPLNSALDFTHDHTITPAEKTALELRRTSTRFAIKIKIEGDDTCCTVDRAAVLAVYQDALKALELPHNEQHHQRILSEATRKVQIVLGIVSAPPMDSAFLTPGQLLKPLEPQYAEPRISSEEDNYGYRAQWRLRAWRKDGWPDRYPTEAVKWELEGDEKLTGRKRMSNQEMAKRWQEEEMKDEGEGEGEDAIHVGEVGDRGHENDRREEERVDDADIMNDIWD
jgi:hypothetical protein